jgi:DNA-binding protein H-NS
MADDIDELLYQLQHFGGITILPNTARQMIESFINDKITEKHNAKLEETARDMRRYALTYQAKVDADAVRLLVEPPKPQTRPKKGQSGARKSQLSDSQKAEYWDGAGRMIRSRMSRESDQSDAMPHPGAQRRIKP